MWRISWKKSSALGRYAPRENNFLLQKNALPAERLFCVHPWPTIAPPHTIPRPCLHTWDDLLLSTDDTNSLKFCSQPVILKRFNWKKLHHVIHSRNTNRVIFSDSFPTSLLEFFFYFWIVSFGFVYGSIHFLPQFGKKCFQSNPHFCWRGQIKHEHHAHCPGTDVKKKLYSNDVFALDVFMTFPGHYVSNLIQQINHSYNFSYVNESLFMGISNNFESQVPPPSSQMWPTSFAYSVNDCEMKLYQRLCSVLHVARGTSNIYSSLQCCVPLLVVQMCTPRQRLVLEVHHDPRISESSMFCPEIETLLLHTLTDRATGQEGDLAYLSAMKNTGHCVGRRAVSTSVVSPIVRVIATTFWHVQSMQ